MFRLTRRAMMSGLASTVAHPLTAAAREAALEWTVGLKDHAARAGIIYGASIANDNWQLPECRALYGHEARIITTDLSLKFAILRPSRDQFNFGSADDIVSWALANGKLVRGHTLIWNEYNGDWVNRCSAHEVERIFDEHIERVVSRYAGRIQTWDVINEPFWPDHGEPGGYRRGPWYNALGPGYIARALRRVHAIDPGVKLCINEAHCDYENSWGKAIRPALARLIGDLRQAGVPLDSVGVQCHLRPAWPHDYDSFAAYIGQLAGNGVDLHISEFDIDDTGFPDATGQRDGMLADYAAAFLKRVLAVPAVTMLINWELIDKDSFYVHAALEKNPHARRLPRPLPFDNTMQRKPLWSAMAAAFDARAASRS